jgi:hypothetical protein
MTPFCIHCNRRDGTQAAIELGVPLVSVLTDGVILGLSDNEHIRKRVFEAWKNRIETLASFPSMRWTPRRWKVYGEEYLTLLKISNRYLLYRLKPSDVRDWLNVRQKGTLEYFMVPAYTAFVLNFYMDILG